MWARAKPVRKRAWLTMALLIASGCDTSSVTDRISDGRAEAYELAPLATPPGITLQPLGKAQGYALDKETAGHLRREQIAYADARGMTLYFNEQDPPGKSLCVDDCALLWPPAIADEQAQPTGNWSVIVREDGTRQWALKGKPLHTYSQDVDIGSVAGNSPKRLGRGPDVLTRGALRGPKPKETPLPKGWMVALHYPVQHIVLPAGFEIKEVPDAMGLVLVNQKGHTLYSLHDSSGSAGHECISFTGCDWLPLAAPQIAVEVGEFSFVQREDGIRQWTWKGRPLYAYAGDLAPGDANGTGVDPRWRAATYLRYFAPPDLSLRDTPNLGRVLATANGQSLYRRDAFIFQSGSGHNLRHGNPVRPAVGRDIGTEPRCMAECSTQWKPFLAPDTARASGYWDIYTRGDGRKQWAHHGFALWTYAGDEQPGSINAHDEYEIVFSDVPDKLVDIGTPYDGPTALYWSVAIP